MKKPRFILDTAELDEIREALTYGVVDAISTNPSKIAQTGRRLEQVVEEILEFWQGPLAVEAMGDSAEELADDARRLSGLGPQMIVKVPVTEEGLKAIARLVPEGIQTNATLVFSAAQALLAGLAGSPYLSPFVSRAEDAGYDGVEVLRRTRAVYDAFGISTQVIAASLHTPAQVIASIEAGADLVAVPYPVFKQLISHPLTREGLAAFEADWATLRSKGSKGVGDA